MIYRWKDRQSFFGAYCGYVSMLSRIGPFNFAGVI